MSAIPDPRAFLVRLFEAAVAACSPAACLPGHLPEPPPGRTVVVGAGKASAEMARVVEQHWLGPIEGLVVTRYGHGAECQGIEVVEAAHPVPDEAGLAAAGRMLELAHSLGEDDLALCLISGGGSALLSLPPPGLDLATQQRLTRELLVSGASIQAINAVRKHLSVLQGGRLALACAPARVVTLAISDVAGDDPSVIASGPTVPDPTTWADARRVLRRYRIDFPEGLFDGLEETPKPGHPAFARTSFEIVARAATALEAAAEAARREGIRPVILGDRIEGESRDVGRRLAELARTVRRRGRPVEPPCVLLSGGETTVTVTGKGRGGPNTELLLSMALALDGEPDVWALAADTDGIDGTETNAGAWIGPDTLERARGVDAEARLEDNDAHGFFGGLGDLVVTGPTRTNVNDFRAVWVGGGSD